MIYLIVSGLLLAIAAGLILRMRTRLSQLTFRLSEVQIELQGANNRLIQNKDQTALLARSDSATGLLVRHVVVERFQLALALAQRQKSIFGIILIRLVDFESLVRHQHDVGVMLLAAISDRLSSSVREIDTVGRVRDHEFALLLPLLQDVGDLNLVLEKLHASLDPPFHLPGIVEALCPKMYFGSASYPQNGLNWASVLRAADSNLQLNEITSKYH